MSGLQSQFFNIAANGTLSLKSTYKPSGAEYEKLPSTIVLPDELSSITVTALENGMFENNLQITSVVLPSTITEIPKNFCNGAHNLTAVENTDNIVTIKEAAFAKTALQRATFNKVTSVEEKIFYCCGELKELEVLELTSLSGSFLYGCAELTRLYAPKCTRINKSSLFMTERLTEFTHSELTYIGLYAVAQSAYRLSDTERTKCTSAGSPLASLWMNSDFIRVWKDICSRLIDGAIKHSVLYSYPQDDEPWSEEVVSTEPNIDWFNWGDYDPVTKKYSTYLEDFDYTNYFNTQYAGELAQQEIYYPSPIDTSTGCTLHSILGAYIGLYKPFGESVVECPKQIQDYIIKITGGRDKSGVPVIVNDWAKSDPVYGDASKRTHTWYTDYKNSNSKFRYYDHKTYGPTAVFNTNYFSTFIADRVGLKCEIIGYNHNNYSTEGLNVTTDDVVGDYLANKDNWEDYLTYFVESIKSGSYAMLCGPGGAGNTQGHATLIYGIDDEGYVYINNTSHFHYRDSDYDSQVCRIPFENVFTFYNAISQSGGTFTHHTNNGTYPITIISKKPTNQRLTDNFTSNCEFMLQDKESTSDYYSGVNNNIKLTSDLVDWDILQEFVDSASLIEPSDSDEDYTGDLPDILIRSSKQVVTLKISGTGKISIENHFGISEFQLTDEIQTIVVNNGVLPPSSYGLEESLYTIHIDNAHNIQQLDLHSNSVSDLIFGSINQINKLVLYDNNIENLALEKCRELQFLHMFNNPICSDIDKMKDVIKQLPDRNNKPFGSIILYDWVNLGLCGYRNAANGLFYHDKEYKYPLKTYANEIYRDIASVEHPWYRYEGGKFAELTDYNHMIMLRRQLEGLDKSTWTYTNKDGSIFKNWVFGSAIQYNEQAWKYCDIPFRNAHIADVWETAEKGEGVGIASVDCNNWIQPSTNFNRVYAFGWVGWEPDGWSTTGGIAPVPVYTTSDSIDDYSKTACPWLEPGCYKLLDNIIQNRGTTDPTNASVLKKEDGTPTDLKLVTSDHGETCYSFMGDRGITSITNTTYGISPESRYYLLSTASSTKAKSVAWHDTTQNDWTMLIAKSCGISVDNLSDASQQYYRLNTHPDSDTSSVTIDDINLVTRSLGQKHVDANHIPPSDTFQKEVNSKSFERIFAFNAQGNDGDGLPYTTDKPTNSSTSYVMSENCNFVSSINFDKHFTAFSTADVSSQPHSYTYSCYGNGVRYYNTVSKSIICGSGTSFSTPLHTAMTSIIWVIYSKVFNLYRLNTDNQWRISASDNARTLLECAFKHHIDPLRGQSRLTIGNGTVDCMQYNNLQYPTVSQTRVDVVSEDVINVGSLVELQSKCYAHPTHSATDGFFIGTNISTTPVVCNQRYCVPLSSGKHTIKCYNNTLNIIPDSNTLSGFTNDTSSSAFVSQTEFEVADSTLNADVVNTGLIYNREISSSSLKTPISEFNQCTNSIGWTVSAVINPRGAAAQKNGIYKLLKTDYFYLRFRNQLIQTKPVKEWATDLKLFASQPVMGREDCDYTDIALDAHNSSCVHYFEVDGVKYPYAYDSEGGYLYQCRDTNCVLTIRKRAEDDLFDVFLNGQYINSHKTLKQLSDCRYTSGIIPCDGGSNDVVNCISICIHNRPLTDEEIVQQMLYMHKTYCS